MESLKGVHLRPECIDKSRLKPLSHAHKTFFAGYINGIGVRPSPDIELLKKYRGAMVSL